MISKIWFLILLFGFLNIWGNAFADDTVRHEAEVRLALVVHQSSYSSGIRPVELASKEAGQISSALKKVGFEVSDYSDLSTAELTIAFEKFSQQLEEAGDSAVGFVYYTGHGVQHPESRRSMLLGIESTPSSTASQSSTIDLQEIADRFSKTNAKAVFIVFDACRNILEQPQTAEFSQRFDGGLAQIDLPRNVLIAYSTSLGNLATEGVYAPVLAEEITKFDQSSENVFARTQQRVMLSTLGEQKPWFNSRSYADICFSNCSKQKALEEYFEGVRASLNSEEYFAHRNLVEDYATNSFYSTIAHTGYSNELDNCNQIGAFLSVFPSSDIVAKRQEEFDACEPSMLPEISALVRSSQNKKAETEATWEEIRSSSTLNDLFAELSRSGSTLRGDLEGIFTKPSLDVDGLENAIKRTSDLFRNVELEGPPAGSKALIISQSDYSGSLSTVKLARSEGELIQQSLSKLGIETKHLFNLTKDELVSELAAFEASLQEEAGRPFGFIYYTGHGIQPRGKSSSFLLGVDASLEDIADVEKFGVDILEWTDRIGRSTQGLTVFIFDACRSTSTEKSGTKSAPKGLFRDESSHLSGAEGLGAIKFSGNSIVLYAADIGMNAQEGIFAPVLAEELHVQNRTIEATFSAVQKRVASLSGENQFPWFNSNNSLYACLATCATEIRQLEQLKQAFDLANQSGTSSNDLSASLGALMSYGLTNIMHQSLNKIARDNSRFLRSELVFGTEAFVLADKGDCSGLALYVDVFPQGVFARNASQRLQTECYGSLSDGMKSIASHALTYVDDPFVLLPSLFEEAETDLLKYVGLRFSIMGDISQGRINVFSQADLHDVLVENAVDDALVRFKKRVGGEPSEGKVALNPPQKTSQEEVPRDPVEEALRGLFGRKETEDENPN